MGLCPSRNSKGSAPSPKKFDQTYTPLEQPSQPQFQLRADAAAFVPKKDKEPWEKFLDQKQQETLHGRQQSFNRKTDGTFTSEYRRLLTKEKDSAPAKYVPPHQRGTSGNAADLLQEWKEVSQKRPASKPQQAKQAKRKGTEQEQKLKDALQKAKALPKEVVLEQLADLEQKFPKDDSDTQSSLVPFGLTDAHYFSDGDQSHGSMHCAKLKTKARAYAKAQPITWALEAAMTKVLFELRTLRSAELGAELDLPRRYCVGVREVARNLKDKLHCPLKAVLVAPDVEEDRVTAKGSLDARLADLIKDATALKIPVVYGLSRARIGQAIKKNVTISVLGILSVRGMQEPFEDMLRVAKAKA